MPGASRPPVAAFVALLRGVNVGGKNMVSMGSLKGSFERMGFGSVATYINSGNILFTAEEGDARKLEGEIEAMLSSEYRLGCRVVVRSHPEVAKLVESLPADWAVDGDWKHNVIFLRHTIDSEKVLEGLEPTSGIERVVYRPGALLWSARAGDINRTAWVKLPGQKVYQDMTVRNLNTTRKLHELLKRMSDS
jgi:uncharacterized protein (DUF1697 family)